MYNNFAVLISRVSPNGSGFWSYPGTKPQPAPAHNRRFDDPNYRAVSAFCHEQNALLGFQGFATLRQLPEYSSFSFSHPETMNENSRLEAAQVSAAFARAASGERYTAGVDYSRPNSFFRRWELPQLMSGPHLREVNRIIVTGDECAEVPSYRVVSMDKETWFFEQSKQWIDASCALGPDKITGEIKRFDCVFGMDKTWRDGSAPERSRRFETYNRLCTWMLETRMDAICNHGAAEQAMGNLLDRLRYTEKTLRADLDIASAL